MRYLIVHADDMTTVGMYEAAAPNLEQHTGSRPVIHAEMSSAADPQNPAFVNRNGRWFCVSRIESAVANARLFGSNLVDRFAAENIALGITYYGRTSQVRKAMAEVINALQTGSLYDAIAEAKAIPPTAYDDRFLTAARLLVFVNTIEDYLEAARSVTL